jgi:two-component system sensor histidine kinase VicK
MNEFRPILAEKHQTRQVNCIDASMDIDKLRMMQVIVNLLSNASKFSPEGGQIYLNVSEDTQNVWFSVSDTGVGINHNDIPKLFSPFPGIMVEGNVRGTGLGLTISKGIIDIHNGEIWAESEGIGKGTTITFTLPLSRVIKKNSRAGKN